jgi:hypothetical protein
MKLGAVMIATMSKDLAPCWYRITRHICRVGRSLWPRRLKARPHYSCSCYSLYTLRVNIRILTRRNLANNWSSVDEDLRAQVKARRVSQRAQAWRARARVMWTHFKASTVFARSNTGSWFRIPLEAWMFGVRLFWVCAVLCVGSAFATGWWSKQPYRLCKRSRNSKAALVQQRAVEPWIDLSSCIWTWKFVVEF